MPKIVALCAGRSAEKASIMIKIVPQMKLLAVKGAPLGFPCICITLLVGIPDTLNTVCKENTKIQIAGLLAPLAVLL